MARNPPKTKSPTPTQASEELPEVLTLALGPSSDGRHALLWLRTRGEEVVGRELVEVQHDAERVERSWRELAWRRFFRGEEETPAERLARAREVAPLKGEAVVECAGMGIVRQGKQLAVVHVEVEAGRVTHSDVLAVEPNLMGAWNALEREAVIYLLENERYEHAKRSASWRSRK